MSSSDGRFTRWSRDAGEVARRVGGETQNALTQEEAWLQTGELLENLTEIVVAQHALIERLAERVDALESR